MKKRSPVIQEPAFERAWPAPADEHPVDQLISRKPAIVRLERRAKRLRTLVVASSDENWRAYLDATSDVAGAREASVFDLGFQYGFTTRRVRQAARRHVPRNKQDELHRLTNAILGADLDGTVKVVILIEAAGAILAARDAGAKHEAGAAKRRRPAKQVSAGEHGR